MLIQERTPLIYALQKLQLNFCLSCIYRATGYSVGENGTFPQFYSLIEDNHHALRRVEDVARELLEVFVDALDLNVLYDFLNVLYDFLNVLYDFRDVHVVRSEDAVMHNSQVSPARSMARRLAQSAYLGQERTNTYSRVINATTEISASV